jgi:mannosyltransferase OCH1-like enzyme
MGKIIYREESFDQLLRKDKNYNEVVHRINSAWNFVQQLYSINYLNIIEDKKDQIPKKIHQVWVGSSFPSIYKEYAQSWKDFHPDWEYRFWTDENIHEIEGVNWELYNSIRNPGQKSDYLRYHILNQFGGIYVDTDFQCLKPLDDLLYLNFFTGIGYGRYLELYIGIMGSIPNHPLTETLIKSMTKIIGGNWRTIFNETGAYFFTRKFIEVIEYNPVGVVAFPMDFFYPYPNYTRKEESYEDYIKPHSYAVHHWAVSWAKKH